MDTKTPFAIKDFARLTREMLEQLQGEDKPLNDVTEGSVVRTLTEVFARELAVCYQQLDKVYRFGFLETAEGVALDNVVALLGIKRYQAGHLEGMVSFARRQPAPEAITIPAGTLVTGHEQPLFKTVERVTLSRGGVQVSAKVSSVEPGAAADKTAAESIMLSIMPRPIWGIETVSNQGPVLQRQAAESDAELRERTRYALQQANRGTTAAIAIAVRSLGVSEVSVNDQIKDRPGEVEVILGDPDIDEALLARARQAVEGVRPAGVQVAVRTARRIRIWLHAILELDKDYPAHKRDEIAKGIRQSLKTYIDALGNGDRLRWAKINSILTSHEAVMVLHATEAYPNFLQIEDEDENDIAAGYQLNNKDVMPNPAERIVLAFTADALDIVLEPPCLDVWLEVEVELEDAQDRDNVEASISRTLTTRLESLETPTVSFTALSKDLLSRVQGTVFRFTLIHDRNGRVIELYGDEDEDTLMARERLQLRQIIFKERADVQDLIT